jgi:transposase-like protein
VKNGASALGIQRVLGLGSYQTAWTWLHKLRRAMIRPDRDRLAGWIEVDETYFGGLEEGMKGRGHADKALIVLAVQADGQRIGRIRMRCIPDASAESLHAFVKDCVEPGSTIHTDAWQGYSGLEKEGYDHEGHSSRAEACAGQQTIAPRTPGGFTAEALATGDPSGWHQPRASGVLPG